jgi:hypothetical protein
MAYFAFVAETKNDFYAIKLLTDSREAAEKKAKQSVAGSLKLHFIGECDVDQEKSHALYERAVKRSDSMRDKNKPAPGCTAQTGALF